ncbi:hypothetical protein E2C01_039552 [Portunus trituberculatus]|uniref:Uncharacterized protein n=1 Tax=Portunus trituberculatus TaxID=210409 RepID=A0A5B7FK36_PORTR|nr:hypothetical protein [Portunus trituberculatus]
MKTICTPPLPYSSHVAYQACLTSFGDGDVIVLAGGTEKCCCVEASVMERIPTVCLCLTLTNVIGALFSAESPAQDKTGIIAAIHQDKH